jgi:hypothetical protein
MIEEMKLDTPNPTRLKEGYDSMGIRCFSSDNLKGRIHRKLN